MKNTTYEIKENFANNEIENIFIMQPKKKESTNKINIEKYIEENIEYAENMICLVLQDALTDTLVNYLHNTNASIYIIIQKIEESRLNSLKGKAIIRESNDISGNYLIIDKKKLIFFDKSFKNFYIIENESVKTVHKIFTKEFWKAEYEFITERKKSANQTFDIPSVEGSENVIIDQSADEITPFQKIFDNADIFYCKENIPDYIKNQSNIRLYLSSNVIIKNTDFIKSDNSREIFFVPELDINLFHSDNNWYITNYNYNNQLNSNGRIFAVKLDKSPIFSELYKWYYKATFKEAVEKNIYDLNLKELFVTNEVNENKQFRCDLKIYNKIIKMSDEERKTFFKEQNILKTDKKSLYVIFEIKVELISRTIKDRSQIYNDYNNFNKSMENNYNTIKNKEKEIIQKIDSEKKTIENLKNEIQRINSDKNKNGKKKSDLENKLKTSEIKIEQLNDLQKELNSQLTDLNKQSEIKTVEECKKYIDKISQTINKLKNKNIELKINQNHSIPKFNLPSNGILYQSNNKYEYEVDNESKLESAIEEMKIAEIFDDKIEFVLKEGL